MVRFGEWPCTGARKIDHGRTGLAPLAAGLFSVTVCCVQPAFAQSSAPVDRSPEGPVPAEIGLMLRLSPALSKSPFKRGKPGIRSGETDELWLAIAPEIDRRRFSSPQEVSKSPLPQDRRNLPDDPAAPAPDSMPGPVLPERAGSRRSSSPDDGVATVDMPTADAGVASGRAWRIPPIRWGGSTGVQVSQSSNSEGARSTSLQETLSLRGASYIYQPWMAQVSGSVLLATGTTKSSSGPQTESESGPQPESQSGSTSLSGGGSLNLFPISRFPATVSYELANSRNTTEVVSNHYTNSRFGVRQSYRPESGIYQASAAFNRSDVSVETQGKSAVNALIGNFNGRLENHNLQSSASYSTSTQNSTGEGSRLLALNAQHAYQAQENLALNSFASVTDNAISYNQGALGLTESHGRFMQFNSTASWYPAIDEEDEEAEAIPLNVSGGVNAFSAQNDTGGVRADNLSLGANVSAAYRYSQNLSLNGNGMVTSVSSGSGSGSGSQMLMVLGGGANYAGDPLNFGKTFYSWNTGVNGNQVSGGVQGSVQTISGQFAHSLARPVEFDDMSLYLTLGQGLSQSMSNQGGNSASISHNGSASYRISRGPSLGGSATLNLSDTITSGATVGHFTSLSLNLFGQAQFDARSSANVNLSFQYSTVSSTATVTGNTTAGDNTAQNPVSRNSNNTNVYGSAGYQHQRFLGVTGLRYTLSFYANALPSAQGERLAGNPDAPVNNVAYSLENHLDYRIGLLDLKLRGAMTSTAGRKNALVFFSVTRQFGRY